MELQTKEALNFSVSISLIPEGKTLKFNNIKQVFFEALAVEKPPFGDLGVCNQVLNWCINRIH